ncbi:cytosolic phospholipase A2-like, partial [Ruditapes philippinarum]|uniref:cytosolic phospholipase A2-like n=1 Tax=Ruditapes philippinarum TaxID=129788 RepID=UPI00295AAF3A
MPYGSNRFDPFQVFEVEHMPCMLFYIKVVKGYNITKGSYTKDWLDVPDPYVTVSIKTSPHGTQKTKHVDNDINPVWNETFKFYLNAEIDNELEISLFDANYLIDEHLSTQTINLSDLPVLKEIVKQRIKFNQVITDQFLQVSLRVLASADAKYRVLVSADAKYRELVSADAKYRVLVSADAKYRVLVSADAKYRVLVSADAKYRVLVCADAKYRVLVSADAKYRVLVSADAKYREL